MDTSKSALKNIKGLQIESDGNRYKIFIDRKMKPTGIALFSFVTLAVPIVLAWGIYDVTVTRGNYLNLGIPIVIGGFLLALFNPNKLFRGLFGRDVLNLSKEKMEVSKNLLGMSLARIYDPVIMSDLRLDDDEVNILFDYGGAEARIDVLFLGPSAAKHLLEILVSYYPKAGIVANPEGAKGAIRTKNLAILESAERLKVRIGHAGSNLLQVFVLGGLLGFTALGLVEGAQKNHDPIQLLIAFVLVLVVLFIWVSYFNKEIMTLKEGRWTRVVGPWGIGLPKTYLFQDIDAIRVSDLGNGLEMDHRGEKKIALLARSLDRRESTRLLKAIQDRFPELAVPKPRYSVSPSGEAVKILIRGRKWIDRGTRGGVRLEKIEYDEELTMDSKEWSLGEKGFRKKRQNFDPSKITHLQLASQGKEAGGMAMKLKDTYGLEFEYEGQKVQLAKGLSTIESEPLLKEITKYLH